MAVSRQKCPSCGGSLAYNSATRLWGCPYCGGSFKIQESRQGPYDIKNVAASVLADAAKGLFEHARRDMAECEKLDPRHPATLAARLGLHHAWLTAPVTADGAAMAAMYDQLKQDRATLLAGGPAEWDDEEAFYETLSADCLAVLLLAWHDLDLRDREETVQQRLALDRVCQLPVNQALFRHYLKEGAYDRLDQVIANRAHLDRHEAFLDLLDAPDTGRKAAYLAQLAADGAVSPDDRPRIEAYLRDTADPPTVQAALVCALCGAGCRPGVACVAEHLLPRLGEAEAPAVLQALCSRKLYEEELRCLLRYGLEEAPPPVLAALLEALQAGGQYVKLDARQVIGFLARTELPAAQRLELFAVLRTLRLDERAFGQIFQEYLLHGADDGETRAEILAVLIDLPERISPTALEKYLLDCRLDDQYKPGIAEEMLQKVGARAVHDLLGRYRSQARDAAPVRREVQEVLLDAGMTLTPAELLEYICQDPDEPQQKLDLLQRVRQNGGSLPAGAAGSYLEVVPPQAYSGALLAALWREGEPVSDKALCRYVLLCPDPAKAENAAALAAGSAVPLGGQRCTASHLGRRIEGSLLQIYLLCAADGAAQARALTEAMKAAGARWNADLTVDGAAVRFRKYAKQNRAALSPLALALCEENKVFAGLL